MKNLLLDKVEDFTKLSQSMGEWRIYLEFIEAYFRNRGIRKPMIVEIGTGWGRQKWFYEELLGYSHIGIDRDRRLGNPDIMGDSRDITTLDKLKERLDGREVNLLYIDGGHTYSAVKGDYEIYSPLVRNIIVIHDIVLKKAQNKVGKFWNELIAENIIAQDRTFITLTGYCNPFRSRGRGRKYEKDVLGQGTGLILLEDLDKK